jgi:hypothetical protein
MATRARFLGLVCLSWLAVAAPAFATPSTQIWIPSTDVQKFGVVHLNDDVFARPNKPTVLMLGPTVGVLPWTAVQAEVGFDLTLLGIRPLDDKPLYLHAKICTPEDSLFHFSPALAVGIFNAGIDPGATDQNVGYAVVARNLPVVGRLSAGYFYGNPDLLVDENGKAANHGLLLSWDRTLTEIHEKLWASVDFQGGQSGLAALNGGLSWAFTPDIAVLVGYDHYLNAAVAGDDTFTVQLDLNL